MTAPDVNADVRARFEARVRQWPNYSERTLVRDGRYPDYYGNPVVQGAWEGYRAAHADLSGEVRELVEASGELMTDMKIAQGNMNDAAKRDPRWEGCAAAIQPRVDRLKAALAKFTHQEKP